MSSGFSSRPDTLMVMCAPNGARRQKTDHPAIPLTAREMANQARELVGAGVSVLHLHVRDAAGQHTLDPGAYRRAIEAIRQAVDEQLVIQVTTEAAGRYSTEQQMSVVRELAPEAVSLALAELCPNQSSTLKAARFCAGLAERGVWAQHIVYTPDEFRRLEAMRAAGMLGVERPSCLFVVGSYRARREGSVAELDEFLGAADRNAFNWAACCFGRREQAVMRAATRAGGHVRLGFENNLLLPDGETATSNAELVRAFLESANIPPPGIADAERIRSLYGGRRGH